MINSDHQLSNPNSQYITTTMGGETIPIPHPLDGLSVVEIRTARQVILGLHPSALINFREIFLAEPRKHELIAFLDIEHAGKLNNSTSRPRRHARCQYDVVPQSKIPQYHESIVDIEKRSVYSTEVVDSAQHVSLTL